MGKWKKTGTLCISSAAKALACKSCNDDWAARSCYNLAKRKLSSYRVIGVTEADEYWEWEAGRCGNLSTCWGNKERIWDVRRSKDRFSFSHLRVHPHSEEVVDRIYTKLERGTGKDNLSYYGVVMKTSQSRDFWPNCLDIIPKPMRHVHIKMSSKSALPERYISTSRNERPPYYQTPEYCNPFRIEFRYYDEPEAMLPRPEREDFLRHVNMKDYSIATLNHYCKEIARTYIEVYPGGAGMRVLQYKWIPQWKEQGKREPVDWLPYWWLEDNYSGYIEGKQHGWQGPIISYWSRVDSINRYFS